MSGRLVTINQAAQLVGWTPRSVQNHIKAGRIPVKGYRIRMNSFGQGVAVRVVDAKDVFSARAYSRTRRQQRGRELVAVVRDRQRAALKHYHAIYAALPAHVRCNAGKGWLGVAKRHAHPVPTP